MYSGNYYTDEGHIKVPDNYSGTSMLEENIQDVSTPPIHIEIPKTEMKVSPKENEDTEEVFLNKENFDGDKKEKWFDIPSILKGFGIKDVHLTNMIPKIGTEELLLIALSAFLLFSKNGDKECALIVFLLIFVK